MTPEQRARLLEDPPDDPPGRALRAGLIIATGVVDDDRVEARRTALDILEDGDGFSFAVFLASATGAMLASAVDRDDVTGTVTVEITDSDGHPVPIDQIDEPDRSAWRAVLAAANGDDAVPFLLTCATTEDTGALLGELIQLFEVATASQLLEKPA